MATSNTSQKALNKKGRKVLALSLLTLVGTVVFQTIGYIIVARLKMPMENPVTLTVMETIAAISAVLGMLVLGGASWLRTSRLDIKCTFRMCAPIIVADILLFIFACGCVVVEGAQISPEWPVNLAITACICLGIGIFEELIFRGILFNGILAVTGKSHRGTMVAIALVSVLFGLVHVDLIECLGDPLLATQAVLKIVQTGLFSAVLCAAVLRTRRLGGASLLHGLSDFLLMAPTLALEGGSLTTNYVSPGEDGVATIVVYLVFIALYLPVAVKALRGLHKERVAYRGAFMERAVAENEDGDHNNNIGLKSGLPVAPAGVLGNA